MTVKFESKGSKVFYFLDLSVGDPIQAIFGHLIVAFQRYVF